VEVSTAEEDRPAARATARVGLSLDAEARSPRI
jgi:hypothetical protein